MNDSTAKVSLILPLYKPHDGWLDHVLQALAPIHSYLSEHGATLQVILANDGTPRSCYPEAALDSIRGECDDFLFSAYDVNHGKGYCLRHAVAQANGDYIIYTDGDFPFGWDCVIAAFDRLSAGADVVMGVRGNDYSGALHPLRKVLSRAVRLLNRIILCMPREYLDTQAGMKGFTATAGRDAFLSTTVDTFIFDLEFILLAWDRGLRIETTPLSLREGLSFSRMGFKVLFRELLHFVRIVPKHWFRRKNR